MRVEHTSLINQQSISPLEVDDGFESTLTNKRALGKRARRKSDSRHSGVSAGPQEELAAAAATEE